MVYKDTKQKMPVNFANYIEADFIAWVLLFDASSAVVRPCLLFDLPLAP